jgi:hypothetical protein
MAKFTRRAARPQLDQRLSDWLDSPQERALRDTARKLALKIDRTPPKPTPKIKKKGAGGPPPKFTPYEIAHLQDKYRSALKGDAALKKQEYALEYLRPLLPRKASVSDSTLRRHIIRPVLPKRSKQPPR